jgi:hypothetical protein
MRSAERRRAHRIVPTAVVAWGLTVAAGFVALSLHLATPGPDGIAVGRGPGGSRVPLAEDRPTLIMFAHPRCPCTRASAAEFARILARCEGRVAAFVLVFTPTSPDPGWGPADWSGRLASIRGVRLLDDPGGLEAARFGARTSSQVVLYGPNGRLLLRGGITGARGHEGDNYGREAVISLIAGRSLSPTRVPVFGCPIY